VVPAVPEAAPKHDVIPAAPMVGDAPSAARRDESEHKVQIFGFPADVPAV